MHVMVVGVAAESGGALSILNSVHSEVMRRTEHQWTFYVSHPRLSEGGSVKVRRVAWVKKSWLHRIAFDLIVLRRELRTVRPDVVLSLQNVPVAGAKSRQVVYLHQALPFSDYRPKFSQGARFWLYSALTRCRILAGLQQYCDIVVQASWMKNAVERNRAPSLGRIIAIPPGVQRPEVPRESEPEGAPRRFFYPAGPLRYKNHALILRAVEELEARGVNDFEVVLTLTVEELRELGIHELPKCVHAVGRLDPQEVWAMYERSVLVFPSLMETVGLPLLEARGEGARILAADLPYARDALEGYPGARFVDPNSTVQLVDAMAEALTRPPVSEDRSPAQARESWGRLLDFVVGEKE